MPGSPFTTYSLRGGLYMITGPAGNATVSVGADGVLVVDPAPKAVAAGLLAELARLSPMPVRYVIDTTGDPDHAGANRAVAVSGRNLEPADLRQRRRRAGDVPAHGRDRGRRRLHPDQYPAIDLEHGGGVQGLIDALNRLTVLPVPEFNLEGGALVAPGHGRLSDEADVAEYRDMITIVRDRIRDMIGRKLTLAQVQTARPTMDYDPMYGPGTAFVEQMYRGLTSAAPTKGRSRDDRAAPPHRSKRRSPRPAPRPRWRRSDKLLASSFDRNARHIRLRAPALGGLDLERDTKKWTPVFRVNPALNA
jgi:cyclase